MDLHRRRIYHGAVQFSEGKIISIREVAGRSNRYLLPGFVDAHVHIESSMLVPSEFARLAVVHGTVATVSDPHEIANVLGVAGVDFMVENGREVPFKFNFGAPSCVPATAFETAGAILDPAAVTALLERPDIRYLSEMMNYPGVIFQDEQVLAKLAAAKALGKPIDGHAPGLRGEEAKKYFAAGIETDHECFTYEEGLEKARLGVKILIREGSAARNFDALIRLLDEFPELVMFCSDYKHPDDLIVGHINQLVARALKKGCDLMNTLRAACVHPVEHYKLPVGLLREGDPADFIVTSDLENFTVDQTWIGGVLVAEAGRSLITPVASQPVNNFQTGPKTPADFRIAAGGSHLRVIRALDGELVTEELIVPVKSQNGFAVADEAGDILKFAVVNRYREASPAVAFINGFNLRGGAIASCVGHDSHNILALGTNDELLCRAVNLIVENKGGICAVAAGGPERVLPLPVAGIMTTADGYEVARQYAAIDRFVKEHLQSTLRAPFMTLSFMALLVIPQLKLSDKGLFDGKAFRFVELFEP